MPRLFSIRPVYFLFVVSLFLVAGCQTSQSVRDVFDPAPKKSEEFLDVADKKVSINADGEVSPLEQHMKARGDVDPTKVNKQNRFTKNAKNSHVNEKNHYRVVRVEGDAEAMADELEVAAAPVDKQTQTRSYIESILERHKAQQAAGGPQKMEAAPSIPRTAKKTAIIRPKASVKSVRIGQHPGKTRIVFDLDSDVQFTTKFVDNNKTLVVSFPSTAWKAEPKTKVSGQSLISGYSASSHASSADVEVGLNAQGKLAYQKMMKPSGNYGHRLVLDVVAR